PDALPWVINAKQDVYRLTPANGWEGMPCVAVDVAVGPDGALWTIAPCKDSTGEGGPVLRWNGAPRAVTRPALDCPEPLDPSQQPLRSADHPYVVQVETTTRCNLKCQMCPLTLEATPTSRQPGHISESLWGRVLGAVKKSVMVTVHGWGEPTLNPNFLRYLQELDRLGL